ncbi:MAG: branched-chain amino acid aminotransferase [Rhodospirillaceae bacterium]|jgi:branched-chain amino acid aminotransferase|nr:branched-chain amino acid aminotransferase [Rhodospirillaceae bacterium]MBT4589597.1 branched-chain amino acid aminotransferase [Rhodospirillaceae bacterium]MBT7266869.1 branched-chain amino acid aminotransferase [Rhodospirillaceae bacterium]
MTKTPPKDTDTKLTKTYVDDVWQEGSPPVLAPNSQAMWLSTVVFDGARALQGHLPDLDLHSARVNQSAIELGMLPTKTTEEIIQISKDGVAMFPDDAELYICPMYYAEDGFITPVPESTKFVLSIYEAPLPEPNGFRACKSSFRRPEPDQAPTNAKASCLYPNVARGVSEAREKGFDCGVVLDPYGQVAEFSYTNLFFAKDGVVHTPVTNGTFLNGVTRQRVIQLLRDNGVEVQDRKVEYEELGEADELFSTGNYSKLLPCIGLDDRAIQPGPLFQKARELYFEFVECS